MVYANLALRFLLELCGLAALAYWGWGLSDATIVRLLSAVGAPLTLAVFWARIVAPRASNAIPQAARILIGTVALLACAGALAIAGQPGLAAAFAILNVANTALLLVLGGPEGVVDAGRAPDPSRRS